MLIEKLNSHTIIVIHWFIYSPGCIVRRKGQSACLPTKRMWREPLPRRAQQQEPPPQQPQSPQLQTDDDATKQHHSQQQHHHKHNSSFEERTRTETFGQRETEAKETTQRTEGICLQKLF